MVKCRNCERLDKLKGEVWFCGYWEDTLSDSFVKEVIGTVSLLIQEARPFQISITDLKQTPPGYKVVSPKDIG